MSQKLAQSRCHGLLRDGLVDVTQVGHGREVAVESRAASTVVSDADELGGFWVLL